MTRFALLALCLPALLAATSPAHQAAGTVVVDASGFYNGIPLGDTMGGGGGPAAAAANTAWLFNNSVINLGSREDAVARVSVPEAGAYRLFVRSQGTDASAFKVSIDGKLAADDGRGTLYFKEPVYHMFDFLGNGAEQVITNERTVLRVYGYRDAKPRAVKRDSEYKRNSIANHMHY